MLPDDNPSHPWGWPPWVIDFSPPRQPVPHEVDFAVVGAGFAGLAAAAWLRLRAPEKSIVVLEAGSIGAGASGRTGGMALAETAGGDLPGLGDVLKGLRHILTKLSVDCHLSLPGAWEIGRCGGWEHSPISWNDSGTLRVIREVPGGTLDPGKLIGGLARAAHRMGAVILERHRVMDVQWGNRAELKVAPPDGVAKPEGILAGKVLFATNGLSLRLSGLDATTHPKLTLAALSAPLSPEQWDALGLDESKPFYTVDLPYLWGRTCPDNSIVWGAGLMDAPPSGDLGEVNVHSGEAAGTFAKLEKRVRGLHPILASASFTHRWGGPILFRDDWEPVFDTHPRSGNGIVIGAFAGHGVALSTYLGAWAADVLLGLRDLPAWGKLSS